MSKQHDSVVETPFIKSLISRCASYVSSGFPVHITGPTGIGKTTIALAVASQFDQPVKVIRGHQELSSYDLLGGRVGVANKTVEDNYIHSVYKKEVRTSPIWVSGQLEKAVKNGYTVVYDEFNRSAPEINNIFLSVLEEKVLPLYGLYGATQPDPFVSVHPNFRILFISNPVEYAGVHTPQDALLDRMITVDLDSYDFDTYVQIVSHKAGVTQAQARSVSELVHRVLSRAMDIKNPSLRAGITIASVLKNGSIPLDPADTRFVALGYDVLKRYVEKEHRPKIKTLIKQEMMNINEGK